MAAKNKNAPENSTVFDTMVYQVMAEKGNKWKGVQDAPKPLPFKIDDSCARGGSAKQKDESGCVIALAVTKSIPEKCSISVGVRVVKVLFWEAGYVYRYGLTKVLRDGIKHFDRTGAWDLPPGMYELPVTKGGDKLAVNKTPEERAKTNQLWEQWKERKRKTTKTATSKNGKTTTVKSTAVKTRSPAKTADKTGGKGLTVHRSRPIPSRQVTVLRNGKVKK